MLGISHGEALRLVIKFHTGQIIRLTNATKNNNNIVITIMPVIIVDKFDKSLVIRRYSFFFVQLILMP